MLKYNLIVIVCSILFNFSSLAQSADSIISKEAVANHGLIFEKELDHKLVDSSYTDIIQLLNLCEKAQAIQFTLLINKAPDDNTILIFKDIEKGSDLSDPSWLMDYNVIKGTIDKNGASQDEIFIVIYSQNQNGGLLPGDYKHLFNVKYEIADMPGSTNNIKSSMKISKAEASTFEGNAIDITSSRDEFKIYLKRI
jgi:hypothetical protein